MRSLALMVLLAGSVAAQDIPGRHIVLLQPGVDVDATVAALTKAHGIAADRRYHHAARGFAGQLGRARAAIANDPRVLGVWPDRRVALPSPAGPKNDGPGNGKGPPDKGGGGDEEDPSSQPPQEDPWGITRIHAEAVAGPVDVDVAIVDTGIDLDHPDLDVRQGPTWAKGSKTSDDDNGHGTHVAGTVGAVDNEIGVVGVAPGARVWAVKVLDRKGSGRMSDVIAGIDWVAGQGDIEILNMSLGAQGTYAPLEASVDAAVAAGVTVVVAAGNSSDDATGYIPASYPSAICVSAIDPASLASFSNYGEPVDVAAPGVDVLSTYPGGEYRVFSGTSMASPHAAGVAALIKVAYPTCTPAEIRQHMIDTGIPQDDPEGFGGDPDEFPEPLIDAAAATIEIPTSHG